VSIEKIVAAVLAEAHERQVEETMETLSEGSEGFYGYPYSSEYQNLPPVLVVTDRVNGGTGGKTRACGSTPPFLRRACA
jgi:hypothetical protein